jgi:hypothetical protein
MDHILEQDAAERSYFTTCTSTNAQAAWRRAVERCTGGLPTWAKRRPAGRKPAAARC